MDFLFWVEICVTGTQVSQGAHPGLHLWPGRTFIFHGWCWGDSQEGGILRLREGLGRGEGRVIMGGRRSDLCVYIVAPCGVPNQYETALREHWWSVLAESPLFAVITIITMRRALSSQARLM